MQTANLVGYTCLNMRGVMCDGAGPQQKIFLDESIFMS